MDKRETEYITALQQHLAFFDRNKDGIIYPHETYIGFRALGFSVILSLFSAFMINFFLSYKTVDSRIPSLLFPIHIKNIHRAMHPNDSGGYDTEGRALNHVLNELFKEFATTFPDRLSRDEFTSMRKSFYKDSSKSGRFASWLEWEFAYMLLKDEDGYIGKENIQGIYDGSIFYYMEKKQKKKYHKD
ncbi:hypothetical protein KP509_04G095000 [Ceratopteris richardii]|uniref:Caleosin n=1 Tax=Ceratopteris richardii TaxID=49495 RepID=A0A8T2V301_CERRI|nr:hypothetical protein KP509_04G095000 [Ceratopteris richardii]KAH7440174.1 hypothetical protein KP509_04G095000 [Ceratopteris richardii]